MINKIIKIKSLSKVFSQEGSSLKVLDDLNFDIEEGSFTTLVGPSGCGKSTLLNILAGLESPSSGSIEILAAGKEKAHLGYVFQTARLLPWKRVLDNITFVHDTEQSKKDKKRTQEIAIKYLNLVGLKDFAKHYPPQLSGGMQQRVGIARALSVEPAVLLMDEPFSHLDEITAKRLRADLVDIWQRTKVTIFFVTHDLLEATLLSDRIIFITQKPARVHNDFSIDLPRPRNYEDLEFFEMHTKLSREFHLMEAEYEETEDRR